MKIHWLATLLSVVLLFAATACGGSRPGAERRRWLAPQTGTNIGRWASDSSTTRQARSKQRSAKEKRDRQQAKKEQAEKRKRDRAVRRKRAAETEEVVTRGGFR